MSVLAASEVTALMPCHREPPAEELLQRLQAQVPHVLIVDDGMPPAAALEFDLLARASGAQVVRLARRSGKGHAIAAGLGAVPVRRGVLVIDSDGQHPPEAIPDFLSASSAADLVIGNRFADGARGMPIIRRCANRVASATVSATSRTDVPDSQCGMRLMHGRALSDVLFPAGGMESETRHLKRCLRAGIPVAWVPIPAIYDGQRSSFRTLRDSVIVMRAALSGYSSDRAGGAQRREPAAWEITE
jgi:hypothetical protein